MPNYDKTGPDGKGSGTGRGAGSCAGSKTQSATFGQKGRCGGVRGSGKGMGAFASLDEEEKFLQQRLATVQQAKKEQK